MVHLWPQQQTLVEIQQCVWVWQYSLCLIKASPQLNTLLEPNDTTIIQHKPSLPHDDLPCGVKHRYCIERNLSSRLFWMLITQVWIVYRSRLAGTWLFILILHISKYIWLSDKISLLEKWKCFITLQLSQRDCCHITEQCLLSLLKCLSDI